MFISEAPLITPSTLGCVGFGHTHINPQYPLNDISNLLTIVLMHMLTLIVILKIIITILIPTIL